MKKPTLLLSGALGLGLLGVGIWVAARAGDDGPTPAPTTTATPRPSGLPLPSSMPLADFERVLYPFLDALEYDQQPGHRHWVRDKHVRDTGNYLDNVDYGTHRAVRVYYSPETLDWLKGGRVGDPPDGAMMVKEQYKAPAERYRGMTDAQLRKQLLDVTVMIRDAKGSADGWFWADYTRGQPIDSHDPPFNLPSAGFGQYCLRCHASAEGASTFAATRNIEGFPGRPLTYKVDDSWKVADAEERLVAGDHSRALRAELVAEREIARPALLAAPEPDGSDKAFVDFFRELGGPVPKGQVVPIPNVTYDHVIAAPGHPPAFLTADQCLSCHGGLGAPYGVMFLSPITGLSTVGYQGNGINVSPFGEWRWSMMGLAGRDPIFFAQLESELALQPTHGDQLQQTCFRCHGVMGERQQIADEGPNSQFREAFLRITDEKDPNYKYGALAREGIGCTACHRIADTGKPLEEIITGEFDTGPDGELYGPFDDQNISTLPMKNALDITPRHAAYVRSSRLCASCHVIDLPVFDEAGKKRGMFLEQTTYLEWVNSEFQNETVPANPKARTCQQCHMPGDYHGIPIRQWIAAVEDDTYPKTDHRAPDNQIQTTVQQDVGRHELLGVNLFGMEMFRQFNDILGVNTAVDFMTGSTDDLAHAIDNAARQATSRTATVRVRPIRIDPGSQGQPETATVSVEVQNLAGHRLPSGVGFRRAFLELTLIDRSGGGRRVAWASGRTNELGIIVGGDGKPLPSEFFDPDPARPDPPKQHFEPHHAVITSQDQAQIYQELVIDPQGRITTSFVALDKAIKDNRLLPRGWSKDGPPGHPLSERFLDATHPIGTDHDPDFRAGSDVVRYEIPLARPDGTRLIASGKPDDIEITATLYYQSIPPFYLRMRFKDAKGIDTKRLYYLASHLKLDETRIESWKLQIAQDTRTGPR